MVGGIWKRTVTLEEARGNIALADGTVVGGRCLVDKFGSAILVLTGYAFLTG